MGKLVILGFIAACTLAGLALLASRVTVSAPPAGKAPASAGGR